jgi:NADP-dependent 3-hydroxy acid dehydrogenase YdfG
MELLSDKIAVITGASSGIGKAIALGLADQGVSLCLVGRKLEKLEEVTKIAQSITSCVKGYRVDLALDKNVAEFVARLKQDFGHVDILIHSAGVISQGQLEDSPVVDFDWQYRINVRAPYVLTQALLPIMKSCKGQIVFLNSSAGLNARANVGQYAATKHALRAIADSLREEVNGDGVRVLSMFLGRTATPMQEAVHKMEGKEYHPERLIQPEDVAAVVINALSLPRTAEVTDIYVRPLQKP